MTTVNFTDLEKLVFNQSLDLCFASSETNVRELAKKLSLEIDTIKGVVGSLVKKGLVQVGEDVRGYELVKVGRKMKYMPKVYLLVNPIINGEVFSYGWDSATESQKENFKI